MKRSSFRYLMREGVRSLWVNRIMSITSIGVLTTCLLLVGIAYLITVNVNGLVGYVSEQSEMSVFLKDVEKREGESEESVLKRRQEQVEEVRAEIMAMPYTKTCTYISKEEGLENTKDMLGDAGYLLDGIKDRNYIPDTFVITLESLEHTGSVVSMLESLEQVDSVAASIEVSDTLTYIQRTVTVFGFVIILILGLISIVIISNTIRATIFARRKEINIMKFVGATNTFIRVPFIVEGFLLGLISALLAFVFIWAGYTYMLSSPMSGTTAWLDMALSNMLPFESVALPLGVFFLVTGVILGTVGSGASIRRYMKV